MRSRRGGKTFFVSWIAARWRDISLCDIGNVVMERQKLICAQPGELSFFAT